MEKEAYNILDIYFRDHFYSFTKHHIDSYREFVRKYIPDVINSYNPISMVKFDSEGEDKIDLKVEMFIGGKDASKLYIDKPVVVDDKGNPVILTPQEARLKNLTYSTNLYADIEIQYTYDNEAIVKKFPYILIGKIPLMVHSDGCILHKQGANILQSFDECPFDQGGYFIIDGKEKVIISQERMVTNRLFIEHSQEPQYTYRGWIRCTTESGEAALLPKTMEFLISKHRGVGVDVDSKGGGARADEEEETQGAEEEDEEEKKTDTIKNKYPGTIYVLIPSIKSGAKPHKIPLFQLFRALGVESDKSILEHIFGSLEDIPSEYRDFIMPSLRHCADTKVNILSQTVAIDNFKNMVRYKTNEYVHSILTNEVFPNMGPMYSDKARFLGYLVKYMIDMILGVKPIADRDDYGYKRIDLSGFMLSQLFHNIYKHFRKNCRDLLDQEYHYGPTKTTREFEKMVRNDNIQKIINPHYISERMERSLKGLWGSSESDEKQEKVQDLSRISYIGFLSNLRRVNTPLDRTIKITSPHRLNAQQWGIICPFESPDGASIGYLKNLAFMAHVSFGTNPEDLMKEPNNCLVDVGLILLQDVSSVQSHVLTKVFLNGKLVGCVDDPSEFTRKLRLLRRNGLINIFTSIAWKISLKEVRINTDPGRGCRPLIIIEDSKHSLPTITPDTSWFDLVFGKLKSKRNENDYYIGSYIHPSTVTPKGKDTWTYLKDTQCCIEFVDIEESDTRMIAMYPKDITAYTTHLEIHPSTILSVVTSNVPYSNHNFAPRNIFYGAQSKQALGIYATNFSKRFDTMGYILHYSQKALITTKNSHYSSNDKLPAGYNVIVAVATYTGYNQEDGIIINKNSLDRGLFQVTSYKSYSGEEKSENKFDYSVIANPLELKKTLKVDIANLKDESLYELLDENGVIVKDSVVTKGSKMAIIGMVHVKEELTEVRTGIKAETKIVKTYTDISQMSNIHHYGIIDKTLLDNTTSTNSRVCKVRFRKNRRAELGDKLCSRHGQKGVIGMIVPEEDMPFTKEGIVPDIIINPHALPSRMTIAHLVECLFAKVCSMEGVIGDGSVFIPVDYEELGSRLESFNFEKNGNEILYNGKTGAQINTEIFIGPTYYLRLKHMVGDKMHSRDKGPKDQLTRQPPSGRSNEGGLRIGEMERDVLLSYGFSQFSKESMMERADKYTWSVCKLCGRTSVYNPRKQIYECTCGSNDIAVIQTPYAYKLMTHELETLGITARLITEDGWEMEEYKNEELSRQPFIDEQKKSPKERKLPSKKSIKYPENESKIAEPLVIQEGGKVDSETETETEVKIVNIPIYQS